MITEILSQLNPKKRESVYLKSSATKNKPLIGYFDRLVQSNIPISEGKRLRGISVSLCSRSPSCSNPHLVDTWVRVLQQVCWAKTHIYS